MRRNGLLLCTMIATTALAQQTGGFGVPGAPIGGGSLSGLTSGNCLQATSATSVATTSAPCFNTSAAVVHSAAGAASTPALLVSGAPFTGGTATTTFPLVYLNNGAAVTTLSTAGTEFGINAPSGFSGHLMNLFVNGGSTRFRIDSSGNTFVAGTTTLASTLGLSATAAPTIANGAGAGTAPGTATVTGNNNAGVITIITGTATPTASTVATVTFNGTLGTVPQGCGLMARNAATAGAVVYTTAPSSTVFTIAVGATALAASTTYSWSYLCL